MLECVLNLSEGRDGAVLDRVIAAARPALLDLHRDPHHHRSVLTLAGPHVEVAARAVTAAAVRLLDLSRHDGVHPRLGLVDVVPFVPLAGSTMADAVAARDEFATWVADELGLPCFVYGPLVSELEAPGRSLPDIRRDAFGPLAPDHGPPSPSATAGAVCAGARPPLVAFNVWLDPSATVSDARRAAASVRGATVRALGFDVGGRTQVSMNLVEPERFGPADAYDAVARLAPAHGAELVGLLPATVLGAIPTARWTQLDLAFDRTIEACVARACLGW